MIILEILKIIGIVLACIVGFVIVLLLIVFFAPIRYKIRAEGEEADVTADAGVRWLFGLARVGLNFQDKKGSYYIKIAWKTILEGSFGKDETDSAGSEDAEPDPGEAGAEEPAHIQAEPLKKEPPEESTQEATEEAPTDREETAQEAEESPDSSEAAETPENTETAVESEPERAEMETGPESDEKEAEKAAEQAWWESRIPEEQKTPLDERIDEWIDAFHSKSDAIQSKIDGFLVKAERVITIIQAETTHRALRHVKAELFNILNHIRPRHISGNVDFGLADPADTGILYGALVPITNAVSKGKLILTPDFDRKEILYNLLVKGRIFIGYMVLCVVRLILDRDLRRVIKVVRRFLNG